MLSRRRALLVCRGFVWGVLAALAAASVLLFPLALLVVPVCGACALLLNRFRSSQAELVGIWLGLASFCGAYAVGNALRPECPPSGVRQVGFENRGCFDSVLFRIEPWGIAALVLFVAAAWHLTDTREQQSEKVSDMSGPTC